MSVRKRALKGMRRGVTYSPKLGQTRIYVTVNPELPSPPLEIWIDVEHKEGSILVGIGHALARSASLALQAGTPVKDIVKAWLDTEGQPGPVFDCDGVTEAKSLPDLVAQILVIHCEGSTL